MYTAWKTVFGQPECVSGQPEANPSVSHAWAPRMARWLAGSQIAKSNQIFIFKIQFLSRGIQFSRASLNGALTQYKTKH